MKNQANFTTHQLETWVAALSIFDARIVNRSVLELGLSSDPFPDLCKVVLRCDKLRRDKDGTQLRTDCNGKPSSTVILKVAEAMELEV